MGVSKNSENLDRDYKLLGASVSSTDGELKKAYHSLVRQYHPDKLVSKGLPEEFIRLGNERLSEINESYDRIIKYREKTDT